ncbi:MAG: cobalamin-binding protein, partial [Halanaerobiaceae bacterium]|nr:cobalamin-binding protein [Halanaerobiaceae bacterium]
MEVVNEISRALQLGDLNTVQKKIKEALEEGVSAETI